MRSYLQAQIDLSAIIHNCDLLKNMAAIGKFCVTAKCNAYGHGIDIVLPAFKKADVDMIAVATFNEAQRIVNLGWPKPILLFGSEFSIYNQAEKQEIADFLVQNQIRITLMRPDGIEFLSRASKKLNAPAIVHVMLDTGMCRMGLDENALADLIDSVSTTKEITIEGIYTHFANADDNYKTSSMLQVEKFKNFLISLKNKNIDIPLTHIANSAAILNLADLGFNMVRPGISVYGYPSSPFTHQEIDIKPSLRLVSFLTVVKSIPSGSFVGYGSTWRADKDSVIGIVPTGYGDGYDRRLSNKGIMKIGDEFVPVIGRVSMDQTIVNLTSLVKNGKPPHPGQEVVIIENQRNAPNSVEAISKMLDTIPYEIISSIGPRAERIALSSYIKA